MSNGYIRKSHCNHFDNLLSLKTPKTTKSKFKIMNILKLPKNRITAIDISQFNSMNATVRKICSGGGVVSREGTTVRQNTQHKNLNISRRKLYGLPYPYPKENCVPDNKLSNRIHHSREMGYFIYHTPESKDVLHASDCELILSKTSAQHYMHICESCIDKAAGNLKYCSLLSNKRSRIQCNHLMHSASYNFEDANFGHNEKENGNAIDATLLSIKDFGQIRVPWKHRHCSSNASSSSGASFTKWDPSKHWLAVTSILLIAGAVGVAVPLALRVSSSRFKWN